jgi:peptide/nickel transport system permease protein
MLRWKKSYREASKFSKRVVWVGGGIVVIFLLLALLSPILVPYNPEDYEGNESFSSPGIPHLMGTTKLGYDVFSRLIAGSRIAFTVVVLATSIAMLIGLPLGLISGYFRGKVDRFLVMVMDSVYAFPSLLLAITVAALLGRGVFNAAIAISVVYTPQYFRVIRNHVLSVREEVYVEAARALGAKPRTILQKYILFNVIQSVPVILTLNAADAILTLAGLGFLGYGVTPPTPEWGYDLSKAMGDFVSGIWWTSFFPGIFIVLLTLGFTLLGEGLNDLLNPLLRGKK